ncbi:MAG: hypothetical protein LBR33_05890 [Propionibacteriaceae bacterium]|jgi:predicted nucleic-acid-binding protein|nr:hypothetical protein [Propionibacteriaceae bacterium]
MPSLDTNGVLRWLMGDVPDQAAAVDAALATGTKFHLDDIVLVEVVYALEHHYLLSRPTTAASLQTVMGQAGFLLDRPLWSEVLPVYIAKPKLSLVDILTVERARRTGRTPVAIFDRKMASQLKDVELLS